MPWYILALGSVGATILVFTIVCGVPVDDTPENTGEKSADLAEMPAPLPSDFPPFHSTGVDHV